MDIFDQQHNYGLVGTYMPLYIGIVFILVIFGLIAGYIFQINLFLTTGIILLCSALILYLLLYFNQKSYLRNLSQVAKRINYLQKELEEYRQKSYDAKVGYEDAKTQMDTIKSKHSILQRHFENLEKTIIEKHKIVNTYEKKLNHLEQRYQEITDQIVILNDSYSLRKNDLKSLDKDIYARKKQITLLEKKNTDAIKNNINFKQGSSTSLALITTAHPASIRSFLPHFGKNVLALLKKNKIPGHNPTLLTYQPDAQKESLTKNVSSKSNSITNFSSSNSSSSKNIFQNTIHTKDRFKYYSKEETSKPATALNNTELLTKQFATFPQNDKDQRIALQRYVARLLQDQTSYFTISQVLTTLISTYDQADQMRTALSQEIKKWVDDDPYVVCISKNGTVTKYQLT